MNLPSLGEREFLATNLKRETLDKLVSLGFEERGATALPLLGKSITRLVPPRGMAPGRARFILDSRLPRHAFTQNRLYRSYRAAAQRERQQATTMAKRTPATNTPCQAERCYGLRAIKWTDKQRACARAIPIGIIDTHIDISHPTFRGRHITTRSFLPSGNTTANDIVTHGTGILALLAGRSDSGTPGLIPDAQFFAADIFFADDKGQPITDTVSVLKALDWLSDSNVKVVNMSVAGPKDDLVALAIKKLSAKGIIITAAAGNQGPNAEPSYPAAYPEVISVTAIDRELHSYRHANRGSYIDFAAPGVGVWTAYPGASEGAQTGTSFAVPYLTAAVAAAYTSTPEKSKAAILSQIGATDLGEPGIDPVYGRGLLHAPRSCKAAPAYTADATSSIEILPWADNSPPPALGLGFTSFTASGGPQ
jgi:hypothetical protein